MHDFREERGAGGQGAGEGTALKCSRLTSSLSPGTAVIVSE